jgi:uncharacterized protein YbjQ (UPF0145 family)
MQISTTPTLEGFTIAEYCGVVTGEAILGANIFRDFFAGVRDIVGGRSVNWKNRRKSAVRTRLSVLISIMKPWAKTAAC